MDVVTFMAPLWRLAGNPAFEQSQQRIFDRLLGARACRRAYESFANSGQGWEHERGTLASTAPPGEVLLSREHDRVALAINSFSTAAGGVDAAAGRRRRRAPRARRTKAKTSRARWCSASGPLGPAVATGGARARRRRRDLDRRRAATRGPTRRPTCCSGAASRTTSAASRLASRRRRAPRARLRDALAEGPVNVHVDIETRVPSPAEPHARRSRFPGARTREQRVVLVAHVQEPGANDNASGCGTLLARGARDARRDSRAARCRAPARTLTFLWLDEIRGSEQWIKDHPDAGQGVVAMMSLDMTGEDTAKTGGTFLIEKEPDPSAIWERPSDPHSEWGAGKVDPAHGARASSSTTCTWRCALRRARDTGWVVRTNPYEGGSDHTVFTRAGVPALLNWHFTDRYYHTNLDTVDKVSAARCGTSRPPWRRRRCSSRRPTQTDAAAMTTLMDDGARRAAGDRAGEQRHAARSSQAWRKWYDEALRERRARLLRDLSASASPRGRAVHLRHVLLDHAARREARHVRAHRLAHDRDPAPRQPRPPVALVERRHDLVLQQP